MSAPFTLVYLTSRPRPLWEYFVDGLVRQCAGHPMPEVIFVDARVWYEADRKEQLASVVRGRFAYKHVAPKPSVWQGPTRLTKSDYFAASNSRNTGICHASSEYIVFIDDLSVMMPDFIKEVRHAAQGKYVVGGAYKKVLDLVVDDGVAKNWVERPQGNDSRLHLGSKEGIRPIGGGQLFGCSCGFPMDALLKVNGYDEILDSMGAEDYHLGITLEKHGYQIWYNVNMMTLEDDYAHNQLPVMKRVIKPGNPDQSHVILNRLNAAQKPRAFGNLFEISQLRRDTLLGKPLPTPTEPSRHWFDGAPLADLG